MGKTYFHRLNAETNNRMWINNPTLEEARLAIQAGAIACTSNPTFAAKMLTSQADGELARRFLREAMAEGGSDNEAALLLQRKLIKRLLDCFLPLWQAAPRREGFVSIQVDPHSETDADKIIAEALADLELGPNVIAKIPVTSAGLVAIGELIARDVPILATEVMSISQALATAELYQKVSSKTGKRPPLFITHITGIFDDHMKNVVAAFGISIDPAVLAQAGCAVARKQYRLLKERGYPVGMLGGGARGLHHFTEFVGSDMHVTINWQGTADRLIAEDRPLTARMDLPTPDEVIRELSDRIPDFRKAWDEDGLTPDQFMEYGAVELFRSMFIKGWDEVLATIKRMRNGQ